MQDQRDRDSLGRQVQEIMNEELSAARQGNRQPERKNGKRKKKKNKGVRILLSVLIVFFVVIGLLLGTKSGRRVFYSVAGNFIYENMNNEGTAKDDSDKDENDGLTRQEDYVTNYLIFGIEEFGGAKNTDSMMIASINTKDNTIKLTSLLRDSLVDIPGYKPNKLNAAYSRGGADKLIETIEQNYRIKLDGYASVNFESFEKIVDSVGGVEIELGEKEAKYLNSTNYISNKKNRNVKPGVNKLNGNQVLGYCRVRKVETLGGANNDYGRIVRQQRALSAIFNSFKSKNLIQQLKITKECLSYVTTDLSQNQIEKSLENVVENRIKKLDTFRVPVDGTFDAPKKYNGIGYPIVLNWEVNRIELYKFIYDDTEKEAKEALAQFNQ